MVSPTEGEVMAVNTEVLENPTLLRQDPYGKGWLLSLMSRTRRTRRRNLVPRMLVRELDARGRGTPLCASAALAGAVAADGGRPAEDLLAALPEANWKEVTGEFFLTV